MPKAQQERKQNIHRGRTAIERGVLSRPLRLAVEASLVTKETTVFDYGCGRGTDLRCLNRLGITAKGWDPVHQSEASRQPADVVHLGYVVNVIEDPAEREQALRSAWALARRLLIVAARTTLEAKGDNHRSFGDGHLTLTNTFQKFYAQNELREWLDRILSTRSVAASLGIFFAFRDDRLRQTYFAAREQRRRLRPDVRRSDVLFEHHREILEPLMDFVTARGRLPMRWEVAEWQDVCDAFGSLPRAFSVVRRVTGDDRWDQIRLDRFHELTVFFALDRFRGRARFSELPSDVQLDVRDFFPSYKNACAQADKLLFSAGNMQLVDQAIERSAIGKKTGDALYVHTDALPEIAPVLRVYEGCARNYVGDVAGANVIKLHRGRPRLSYLSYPDFDRDPHPALAESLLVDLKSFDVVHRRHDEGENPPILHRKETFLPSGDARRPRFEKLTKQEERAGLYEEPAGIGRLQQWRELLEARGLALRGHRLVRRVDHRVC